jgi:hypothetical protein
MSFNAANLAASQIMGWPDTRTYDYSTSDTISDVETSGYFSAGGPNFRVGDIVRVTANDGKALYLIEAAGPTPFIGITKFASGVTSFPIP